MLGQSYHQRLVNRACDGKDTGILQRLGSKHVKIQSEGTDNSTMSLDRLLMNSSVAVEQYQQARRASKAFRLRLIELVSLSIHQVGTMLYNLNLRLHKGDVDSVIFWRYPDQPDDSTPRSTLFYHPKLTRMFTLKVLRIWLATGQKIAFSGELSILTVMIRT